MINQEKNKQGSEKKNQGPAKVIAFMGIVLGLCLVSVAQPVEARGGAFFAGAHPRRNEVLGRNRGLSRQMNQDYGHLGGHYNQLQREGQGIRRQERRDFRNNGGYLTRGQQMNLNREENSLQRQVNRDYSQGGPNGQFRQNHPQRAEVLGRDSRINGRLNADYGQLGGNYGQLKAQDRSIRAQERTDARANGGYITGAQRQQLNQEENQLNQQIKQDYQ